MPTARPTESALLTMIVLAALACGGLPARAAPSVDRYRACIERARTDPAQALDEARRWQGTGGGLLADRCIAAALVSLERYSEAAERLQAAANLTPSPLERASLLGQTGNAWLLAERPDDAIEAWTQALQILPEDPGLLIDRSQGWIAIGRTDAAIEDLSKAIDLDRHNADALVYRASAYRQAGALVEARADLGEAMAMKPDHPEALLERGIIRRLTGDRDGAKADWSLLLVLAPDTPAGTAARRNLAGLAAEGG